MIILHNWRYAVTDLRSVYVQYNMAPVNVNAVSIGVLDPRIHTKFVFLTCTGVMENGKRYTYCFLILHSARNVKCSSTYRFAMHFSAKRGLAIACRLSVCPSIRRSVTLVDCDHIGWNS